MGYNTKELRAWPLEEKHKSKPKDVIYDPQGQWKYPGQVTKIPGGDITMQGVSYPVLGIDSYGTQQLMMPGMDYSFPGDYVTEYPQMGRGGGVKGTGTLDKPYMHTIEEDKARSFLESGNIRGRSLTYAQEELFKAIAGVKDVDDEGNLIDADEDTDIDTEYRRGGSLRLKRGKMRHKDAGMNIFTTLNFLGQRNAQLYGSSSHHSFVPSMKNGGWLDKYDGGGDIPPTRTRDGFELDITDLDEKRFNVGKTYKQSYNELVKEGWTAEEFNKNLNIPMHKFVPRDESNDEIINKIDTRKLTTNVNKDEIIKNRDIQQQMFSKQIPSYPITNNFRHTLSDVKNAEDKADKSKGAYKLLLANQAKKDIIGNYGIKQTYAKNPITGNEVYAPPTNINKNDTRYVISKDGKESYIDIADVMTASKQSVNKKGEKLYWNENGMGETTKPNNSPILYETWQTGIRNSGKFVGNNRSENLKRLLDIPIHTDKEFRDTAFEYLFADKSPDEILGMKHSLDSVLNANTYTPESYIGKKWNDFKSNVKRTTPDLIIKDAKGLFSGSDNDTPVKSGEISFKNGGWLDKYDGGGNIPPKIFTNANDPEYIRRKQSYKDSLDTYNFSINQLKRERNVENYNDNLNLGEIAKIDGAFGTKILIKESPHTLKLTTKQAEEEINKSKNNKLTLSQKQQIKQTGEFTEPIIGYHNVDSQTNNQWIAKNYINIQPSIHGDFWDIMYGYGVENPKYDKSFVFNNTKMFYDKPKQEIKLIPQDKPLEHINKRYKYIPEPINIQERNINDIKLPLYSSFTKGLTYGNQQPFYKDEKTGQMISTFAKQKLDKKFKGGWLDKYE